MIEVTNLVKQYGNHTAVDHLNFKVEKGKIYGFLGPNGAGKSTTMNIITGYIAATEGEVKINGHDIFEEPEEAKKCIGYLPELPPLYMDMTPLEYLRFVAELKGIQKAKIPMMVEEVMEMTKITEMSHRLIKNLSKGYKQRVGLAQALLGYPQVLILDEPTVGLDPKQIIEMRELIRELGKNHTIILSSHILQEISAVCDYVMIISKGKMVLSDSMENLNKITEDKTQLSLTIQAGKAQVKPILEKLKSVGMIRQYDFTGEKEGTVSVHITSREGEDIRSRLFFDFAAAKCAILELHLEQKTLEDIFLERTGKEWEENGSDL